MPKKKIFKKILIGIGVAFIVWLACGFFVELKFASFIGSVGRTGILLRFYVEKTNRFPKSEQDLIKTLNLQVKETQEGIMYTSSDPNICDNTSVWIGIPLFHKLHIRYGTQKNDIVSKGKKLYLRSSGQQVFLINGPYNNWALFKWQYEGESFMIYQMMQ